MPAIVVLGAQWGDEGKGKIVDALAKDADVIVRFGGGANAGHTVVIDGVKRAIHLLPSGIFRAGKMNIVGSGVAFDLEVGAKELELAKTFDSQVMLDESTPIVLPIHRLIDAAREAAAGSSALGTTKRGIGPLYSDFVLRRGPVLGDLYSRSALEAALTEPYWSELCAIVEKLDFPSANLDFHGYGVPDPLSLADTIEFCLSFADRFVPHLRDTRAHVHQALAQKKHVLFEGAQGVMLDVFQGSRPYCTSSICTLAGVSATYGVYKFNRVIGVTKAYATRVGAGPFPTEIDGEEQETLRRLGNEFGTTTSRPRRCGWLDLPALSYACRMGGITELVITKIDVLSQLPSAKMCFAYRGLLLPELMTLTRQALESVIPHYVDASVPAFVTHSTCFRDFPREVQSYIARIECAVSVPVTGIGFGSEREQIVWLDPHRDPHFVAHNDFL